MNSKRKNALRVSMMLFIVALSISCATTHDRLLDTDSSQLQLRSIQTRTFDTIDRDKTLRAVISTLQDLGFIVDKADYTLGMVSATKIDMARSPLQSHPLRLTVTVRPKGERQLLVRANAEYNLKPVTEPKPYQSFFAALSKSMFLEAQEELTMLSGKFEEGPETRSTNGTARRDVTKTSEKSEEGLTEKVTVLETRYGFEPKYFHKPDCRRVRTFSDQSGIKEISKREALKGGYTPCPWCMGGK